MTTTEMDGYDAAPVPFTHLQIVSSLEAKSPDPLIQDKKSKDLPLTGKEERARGQAAPSREGSTSRRRLRKSPGDFTPDPAADRLVAWVREKLAALDYDAESLAEAEALCRSWVAFAGRPDWCAQAYQAGVDYGDICELTPYARKILIRMHSEQQQGLPVLAPAFCDFKADPGLPDAATPAPPAPAGRFESSFARKQKALLATFNRPRPEEATDGDRA
jgi:hypothetical protein